MQKTPNDNRIFINIYIFNILARTANVAAAAARYKLAARDNSSLSLQASTRVYG